MIDIGKWDWETPEKKNCAAVVASHARGLVLDRLEVSSPEGIGFAFVDNVAASQFTHLSVYDGSNDGFLIVRDVTNCTFTHCIADCCGNSGFHFADWPLEKDPDTLRIDERLEPRYSIYFALTAGPSCVLWGVCWLKINVKASPWITVHGVVMYSAAISSATDRGGFRAMPSWKKIL